MNQAHMPMKLRHSNASLIHSVCLPFFFFLCFSFFFSLPYFPSVLLLRLTDCRCFFSLVLCWWFSQFDIQTVSIKYASASLLSHYPGMLFWFLTCQQKEVKNINTHKSPIFEYGFNYKGTDHSNNSSRAKLKARAETSQLNIALYYLCVSKQAGAEF